MVHYDPFDHEIIYGEPHAVYKQLRDESPIHFLEKWDCWALSRFQDVWDACVDAHSYSAARGTTPAHLLTKVQQVTPTLNNMDPPEHTKLRGGLRKHFMPARVRALGPWIQALVERLLRHRFPERFQLG